VYTLWLRHVSVHVDCVYVCKRCGTAAADCYAGESAEKAAATERELNEFWPTKYETLSGNVGPELCSPHVETAHISNEEFKITARGRRDHWLESSLH
jgi:hypothetical protein